MAFLLPPSTCIGATPCETRKKSDMASDEQVSRSNLLGRQVNTHTLGWVPTGCLYSAMVAKGARDNEEKVDMVNEFNVLFLYAIAIGAVLCAIW